MEQLLIRLGSRHEDPVHWIVLSADGQDIIASGDLANAGELVTLSQRAGRRPVVALAPGSEVLLKWVSLPPRAGRKVLSAIPFMLEDELAQDISTQFFALGPKRGDQQAVAVVAREKMDAWQQWITDANLSCDHILPDVLAVPWEEGCWSVLSLGNDLLIRENEWSGMQGESEWILIAIAHKLRQQDDSVKLNNYSDLDVSTLTNVTESKPQAELPMHLLATEGLKTSFNLLQGDYRIRRKKTGQLHQWRVAAVLAVLALTASLADKGVSLYQLKQQNSQLEARINQTVEAGFPNLGPYRDVRRKLESELTTLEQGGTNASLLVMIDQLTPAFSTSGVKPQTLRFDASRTEIRMQAEGPDFEALERFRRQAESVGYNVEQGAINNREDSVIGTLAIRNAS